MQRLGISIVLLILLSAPASAGWNEVREAYNDGDNKTAAVEVRWLAKGGDLVAQHLLGRLYETGLGVPIDYTAALEWYRRAAVRDHAESQLGLGSLYAQGKGVHRDQNSAATWLRKSAEKDNADAQYMENR